MTDITLELTGSQAQSKGTREPSSVTGKRKPSEQTPETEGAVMEEGERPSSPQCSNADVGRLWNLHDPKSSMSVCHLNFASYY